MKTLVDQVDVVLHAAATVNLVYPYAALRAANVEGTREIIRFACQAGATLQYVSTNGVLPPSGEKGWPESSIVELNDVMSVISDGYGQSKWVAEQLVLEAGRRGLPVRVHRVGTISGHSKSGSANNWDLLNALIVESIHLGVAPNVTGWRCEMTPVDFVARSIVHLADEVRLEQRVFHIGDSEPVPMSTVFKELEGLGYPTTAISYAEWVDLWKQNRSTIKGDDAFTADVLRGGIPDVEFLSGVIVLDDQVTKQFTQELERPKLDRALLETYTRHWFAQGWLPNPPKSQFDILLPKLVATTGPLDGKVAVVVGASSGIGAATAVALSQAGCHVVLAARRLDALDVVKKRMTRSTRKIIVKQMDVTNKTQVDEVIKDTENQLGTIDILINCAGVMFFTMMKNVQHDDWNKTVDVNCKGLLNCLAAVIPGMLSRGTGHIVAISSDAGRKAFPGLGVYSASKFFVEATLQSLRLETVGSGLRVTSIQPGNVATDLLGMSTDTEALQKYGEPSGAKVLSSEDVARSIIYALEQSEHVSVNEILIEPRDEPI